MTDFQPIHVVSCRNSQMSVTQGNLHQCHIELLNKSDRDMFLQTSKSSYSNNFQDRTVRWS